MAYIGNTVQSTPFITDTFSGDSSTVNFGLTRAPASTASIAVFVGGSYQRPGTYTLSGSTLTFGSAPTSGTNNIVVLHLGNGSATQVPSDGSVTLIRLASDTYSYINSAFTQANTPSYTANSAASYANSAFLAANSAFTRANNSLNANTGGSITGDVSVTGNLTITGNVYVTGNTTAVSANNVYIDDTLLYIANNNPANANEIGFIGHFTQGSYQHTGLVRDHADSKWKLFSNIAEPGQTTISFTNAVYDTLKLGTLEGDVLTIKGIDLQTFTNNAYTQANTGTTYATSAGSYANSAFLAANTPSYTANSAGSYANSAFTRANNSINANTGGTITADLVITGNLTVQGNTTYVDTKTITAGDSLIHLANNNTVGDTVDIGFYGSYNSGGLKYTGLVRQAGANYFLFKDLTSDPTANVLAPGSLTAANTGTLTANLTAYSVTINGQDINLYTTNAYTKANTASSDAAAAGSYGNSAFAAANSASSYANSAFATANNSAGVNLTQNASITAAFTQANAAFLVANGAAYVANTDYTNLTISAGNYGTASAVASFKVEANGRISSANNTSIAIDASAITSGTLGVARGGSGAGTFTNNGVLLGQGTSAFATASSSTEGHVLTINSSGVPTFAMISGGTF